MLPTIYVKRKCCFIFAHNETNQRAHYLLTAWSRVLLEKLTGSQLAKKFPAFYGTRMFITAFTSTRHLSLFWARSSQSMPPYPTYWRFILILSSHLSLGLPSGLFPSDFPTKTLYTSLLSSHVQHARPSHSSRFDHPNNTRWGVHYAPKYVVFSTPC